MIQLDMYKSQAAECRGEKLTEIIKQATEANDLYFFGEFLELPSVRELENDPLGSPYYRLLNLFTYGTCKDYMNQAASFPALTEPMMIKLRHLTLASLATKNKLIPYSTLLDELNIETIRELEDLLISAIYANVIGGKLDQQCAGLEVDWTIGRDIKTGSLDYVSESLESWSVACTEMLGCIKSQIAVANTYIEEENRKIQQTELEVSNIRQTMKAAAGQQDMELSSTEKNLHPSVSAGIEMKQKKTKTKGLRGSSAAKLWSSKN